MRPLHAVVVGVIGLAVFAAGCGGAIPSSNGGPAMLKLDGHYLVDGRGQSVYLFEKDDEARATARCVCGGMAAARYVDGVAGGGRGHPERRTRHDQARRRRHAGDLPRPPRSTTTPPTRARRARPGARTSSSSARVGTSSTGTATRSSPTDSGSTPVLRRGRWLRMTRLREGTARSTRPIPDEVALPEQREQPRGPAPAILRTLGALAVLVVGAVHLERTSPSTSTWCRSSARSSS